MLLVSRFQPELAKMATLIAVLWQGSPPADVTIREWIYLETRPLEILLVWEAGGDSDRRWMEDHLAPFGKFETVAATDGTPGMVAVMNRDLVSFAEFLRARGDTEDRIRRELDLRRRGREAATMDDAVTFAEMWMAEQTSSG